MKSHELLRFVFKKHGCKRVASELNLSLSLIHKWTEPSGVHGSGELNPLDRIAPMLWFKGGWRLAQWVCEQRGGFFVKNPVPETSPVSLLVAENEMNHEQAEFTAVVTGAAKKGSITPADAEEISARWERVKSATEGFVQACERGTFRCGALFLSLGWWFATGEVLVVESV